MPGNTAPVALEVAGVLFFWIPFRSAHNAATVLVAAGAAPFGRRVRPYRADASDRLGRASRLVNGTLPPPFQAGAAVPSVPAGARLSALASVPAGAWPSLWHPFQASAWPSALASVPGGREGPLKLLCGVRSALRHPGQHSQDFLPSFIHAGLGNRGEQLGGHPLSDLVPHFLQRRHGLASTKLVGLGE